jgi:hypothetical protein
MMRRDEGHPFTREFRRDRDRIESRMAQMRRARRIFNVVALAFAVWALAAGGWLLLHPEQIGTFIGRVAAGVQLVAGAQP